MAIKGWKLILQSQVGDTVKAWANTKTERVLSVEDMDYKPKFAVIYWFKIPKEQNGKILAQNLSKPQAIKFAKAYMRKN